MNRPFTRRNFLSAIPAAGIALTAFADLKPAKITAIEIWDHRGHREVTRGVDQQYQVNPLFIYDELRPAPYRDNPNAAVTSSAVSALYLKIKTDLGVEGFYGPIDKEVAIVVDQQLRPFLMGKDALAREKLWDQLYRSNRHARRGHFLMAISAVDNTLWDLCGRYLRRRSIACSAGQRGPRSKPTPVAWGTRWSSRKRATAPSK